MKTSKTTRLEAQLVLVLACVCLALSLCRVRTSLGQAAESPEYERYVRSHINQPPYGNWTYVEKPMFPVWFNESQIAVGSNWTIVSPLTANKTYHVYAYGEWIDDGPDPLTDYDVYVYNPLGELEGYHTESAGLPEHLGNPFYTPGHSGNYSFVLRNDPRESRASGQATLMIIEHVQTNQWHGLYVEGKENDSPVFNTSWAYEFATESQRVEVHVRVPETLDMYEARLYLMANPSAGKGEILNDIPLALEQGLYGDVVQAYGGYNLESKEYRGVAFASCEKYGQEMLINYTSPTKGKSLYHLVFIGERGKGDIDFLVKTEFGQASLRLVDRPLRVYPENPVNLTFVSGTTDLTSATLNYSAYEGQEGFFSDVQLTGNRTFVAHVPGQQAGTVLSFEARAIDTVENLLACRGNYTVRYASELNMTLKAMEIPIGQNITLSGRITPAGGNLTVTLVFTSANGTFKQDVHTLGNGAFTCSYRPGIEGVWLVQAGFYGNDTTYPCSTESLKFRVGPPSFFSQYSTYIYAGVGAGLGTVAAAVVYVKKRRG